MVDEIDGAAAKPVTPPCTTAFLNLSAYMYVSYNTPYSSTPLQSDIGFTPLIKNGKPLILIDNANGVYAEAFVSTTPGPKQVILGFEGTKSYFQGNQFTAGQLIDDFQLYGGKKPDYASTVVQDARKVENIAANMGISKKNVYLTGHSLGAAEAEYAAAKTGLGGDAFAGPGINTQFTKGRAAKITDYVDAGDPVGNYAADGNNSESAVLVSQKIKHYGNLDVLPNADGQSTLEGFNNDYAAGLASNNARAQQFALIGAIATNGKYHEISQYASDLDVPLYLQDASVGADNDFFGAAGSATTASQGQVDTSYIAASLTGGGGQQTSNSSLSASSASALAANALGIKAHHAG